MTAQTDVSSPKTEQMDFSTIFSFAHLDLPLADLSSVSLKQTNNQKQKIKVFINASVFPFFLTVQFSPFYLFILQKLVR
jgi:hypothetical protein